MEKSKKDLSDDEDIDQNEDNEIEDLESNVNKIDMFMLVVFYLIDRSILEEHCKKCIEEENFADADLTKTRIKELKEEQRKIMVAKKKIEHERVGDQTDSTYQSTLDKTNADWDEKLEKLEQHFIDLENQLIEKQKEELTNLHEKLEQTIPVNSKPSTALLNLRSIQQNLVKQKK